MDNFITHLPILEELEGKFKNKQWNEQDVLRWCQQVETLYVADPDAMFFYMNIHLTVTAGKVMLPSNLYKLQDVYDPETEARVRYNRQGMVLKQLVDYDKDTIAVNYVGTPIDADCMPMIHEDHYPACETFCKIQGFESDVLYNEINQGIYQDWKVRFDGMIQGVKGGFRDWSSQEFGNMTVIMGNEIPKIGYMPLSQNFYGKPKGGDV